MTILSNRDITERLGNSVIIEPFNPQNVNTSSYDVTLGQWYFIEHRPSFLTRLFRSTYNIWSYQHVERVWGKPIVAREARSIWKWRVPKNIHPRDLVILIPRRHTILAHTLEFIGGRLNVTTMMKARSSFGRNFIAVCKCAGYGDVGYTNRWTMEITNYSRFYRIPLVVGRRIAQIVFMETGEQTGPDYTETGKYQRSADVRELEMRWRPEMMLPRLDKDRDVGYPAMTIRNEDLKHQDARIQATNRKRYR
jgi:dCTP deaminase